MNNPGTVPSWSVFAALLALIAVIFPAAARAECGGDGWSAAEIAAAESAADETRVVPSGVDVTVAANGQCGALGFNVSEKNGGDFLGAVEVSAYDDHNQVARGIVAKAVVEMLKTGRDTLKSLVKASADFDKDRRALYRDFGIRLGPDTSVEGAKRYAAWPKQRLYASAERCLKDGSVSERLGLPEGELVDVQAGLTKYVQGRTDYSDAAVYKPGQLRKIFFDDGKLMQAFLDLVHENQKSCAALPADRREKDKRDWDEIARRLRDAP